MADMNAVRDRILELAADKSRPGYVTPTTNNLYERLAACYRQRDETVPISRTLFYRWSGSELGGPSHQLLECVPGFAAIPRSRSTNCSRRPGWCAPSLTRR